MPLPTRDSKQVSFQCNLSNLNYYFTSNKKNLLFFIFRKLPETLSDGEVFGLNEKWYYFPCFSRKTKVIEMSSEGKKDHVNHIDITHL